jgi:hypothetical protein
VSIGLTWTLLLWMPWDIARRTAEVASQQTTED